MPIQAKDLTCSPNSDFFFLFSFFSLLSLVFCVLPNRFFFRRCRATGRWYFPCTRWLFQFRALAAPLSDEATWFTAPRSHRRAMLLVFQDTRRKDVPRDNGATTEQHPTCPVPTGYMHTQLCPQDEANQWISGPGPHRYLRSEVSFS